MTAAGARDAGERIFGMCGMRLVAVVRWPPGMFAVEVLRWHRTSRRCAEWRYRRDDKRLRDGYQGDGGDLADDGSGCWLAVRTSAYGKTRRAMRPERP